MADRIEDLRGWWERSRRRRLRPGVQAWVDRVRPSSGTPRGPLLIPATTGQAPPPPPPDPVDPPVPEEPVAAEWSPVWVAPDEPAPTAIEPGSADPSPSPSPSPEPEPEPGAPTPEPASPVVDLTWAPPGTAPWETPVPAAPAAAAAEPAAPAPEPGPEPPAPAAASPTAANAAGATPPPLPAHAPDPWAGITWSAADQPAPWTPAPTSSADDDPFGLDDDQRRWLGRDVRLVESIGPGYGKQLDAVGVHTLQDLLVRGATRRGRQEIVDSTGISGKLILRWVNNADLFRIRGVGSQYADLLEAAGVDTVVELALRRPDNLAARLATTNELRSLVRQVPSETQVADWVRQAGELPRIVAY